MPNFAPDPDFTPEAAPAATGAPGVGADPDFTPEWTQGVLPTAGAAALGAVNAATLGIGGHALDATGLVPKKDQKALEEAHPIAGPVGGAAGILAANLIPGLGEAADVEGAAGAAEAGNAILQAKNLIPTNAIGAIAEHFVPEAAEGAGALARIGTGAARGAVEGALFSSGGTAVDALHNLAIGDPDHATEHILTDGGMDTLFSAGLGAAIGGGIAGAGLLKSLVGPAATKAATAASDALDEQTGSLAMKVFEVTAAQTKNLLKKGEGYGLADMKKDWGVTGNDFPTVLGKIAKHPDAMAPNPVTGVMEPLLTAGDTVVTANEKVQWLKDSAGAALDPIYSTMDRVGPGLSKTDLVDALNGEAERLEGDPTAKSARNQIRDYAKQIDANDADFIKPSEAWGWRKSNDKEIFRKNGLVKENVDAEHAFRDTLDDALHDYAKEIPALSRWPNAATVPEEATATLLSDLEHANARFKTWAEFSKFSQPAAESFLAKEKTTAGILASAFKAGVRGAKGGGVLGALTGGGVGAGIGGAAGAVAGAATSIARDFISPSMASRTLAATRGISDYLAELAPKMHALMETNVHGSVEQMWHAAKEAAPIAGRVWELPRNATGEDVHALSQKLDKMAASNGVNFDELRQANPALVAAMAAHAKGAAGRLKMKLPLNPYAGATSSMKGWAPTAKAVHDYNEYARGTVEGIRPTLKEIAAGRLTSARVAGTREAYPKMAARVDALLAHHVRTHPEVLSGRGVKSSLGVWFGRPDPVAAGVAATAQRIAFGAHDGTSGSHPQGGARPIAQSHIDAIKAPAATETATQAVSRQLGK